MQRFVGFGGQESRIHPSNGLYLGYGRAENEIQGSSPRLWCVLSPERCYGAGLELDHLDHYLFHSEPIPESVLQAGAGQSKRELG